MELARVVDYMGHVVKEAVEIQLYPNNFNRDIIHSELILKPNHQYTLTDSAYCPNWLAHGQEHWSQEASHKYKCNGQSQMQSCHSSHQS